MEIVSVAFFIVQIYRDSHPPVTLIAVTAHDLFQQSAG